MSDSAAGALNGEVVSPKPDKGKDAAPKKGFFGRIGDFFRKIAVFVRQVISELKKVVTPTRSEYINYVIVVIIFILIVMAFVLVLDFLVGKGVGLLFG